VAPVISTADVQHAETELAQKSKPKIEHETAQVWAARALAAYGLFMRSGDRRWLADALGYDHEAREHAGEAGASTLDELAPLLDQARWSALKAP
jgi:hypothetical protein